MTMTRADTAITHTGTRPEVEVKETASFTVNRKRSEVVLIMEKEHSQIIYSSPMPIYNDAIYYTHRVIPGCYGIVAKAPFGYICNAAFYNDRIYFATKDGNIKFYDNGNIYDTHINSGAHPFNMQYIHVNLMEVMYNSSYILHGKTEMFLWQQIF